MLSSLLPRHAYRASYVGNRMIGNSMESNLNKLHEPKKRKVRFKTKYIYNIIFNVILNM